MMNDKEKINILNDFEGLIKKKCFAYKIYGFTKEELIQEVKTHLCYKLDNYSSKRGSLPYYIEMSINNKLNNLYKSPYNKKEILKPKIYINEEEMYGVNDRIALQIAFDILKNHEHKEMIIDRIKGYTFKELSDKYGYTRQYAHDIYKKFIEEVRKEV